MTWPTERLPFAPIEALVADPRLLAEGAGFTARRVFSWRAHGLLPETADRLALSIGLHPANVWPEWLGCG